MSADVIDLGEYRARRRKRALVDQLREDLENGILILPPSSSPWWRELTSLDHYHEAKRLHETPYPSLLKPVPNRPSGIVVDEDHRDFKTRKSRRRAIRAAAKRRRAWRGW